MSSLKILLCALLVAAAVAHDFKTCGSGDKLGVKTVTVDPDSPIPGKPLEVTFTGTPTQDIVAGDSLTITVKVFGIALGHVDFDICKDVGITCPVKAGTASTWKATYNIPSAAPGGVPLTAEFTAQTAAKAQYSCLDVDVVMGKPPALSFAELAMHAQGPSCAHFEDRHDEDHRKCYEACGLGDFKVTGLNETGPCPDDYTQLDSTKTVEACNDGVTNLKYCKGQTLKPVSLRESTKGIKGMCYHKDSGNKCYEGCAMTEFMMTGLSEDGACDRSYAVVEKTFYSMACSDGKTNTKYCFHPLYLVNVTMKTKGKGVALSAPNGDVTLYKVSGDECGQATLDSKYASYAEKFAGLTEGSCTAQGYTVADGTQTLKVPVLGDITIAKFKKAVVTELASDETTLYKISDGECGQATLDSKYASYAEKFAGLTEGTCTAQGYTVADGTQTLKVPVLGDITIAKFKKATVTELASDETTLYKISDGECGQATLDSKYASYAEKFAGLTEGTCTAQGYTVADGTQTLKVPVLGDITIAKFKKAT